MLIPREYLETVLQGNTPSRVPVLPLLGFSSAWIYKVDFQKASSDGELMAKLQVRLAEALDLDGLFTFMDLTVEPEALGAKILWRDIPAVEKPLPISEVDTIKDKLNDYPYMGRLPEFIKAVKRMKELAGDKRFVCGYVGGGLSLGAELFGVEETLRNVRRNPSLVKKIIDESNKFSLKLGKVLAEEGADCVMILEPVGALISIKSFKELLLDSLKELVATIKKSGAHAFLHICGNANHVIELMEESGAEALSIDKFVKISNAKQRTSKPAIMGNIGTAETYTYKPEKLAALVEETIKDAGPERFILSTGCEVPPYTPYENLETLVKTAKKIIF